MTTATPIKLSHGAHRTRADGVCATEAVAWLANEPHSDHPACLSRVIGDAVRKWNDDLNDDDRQQLVPLLPAMIGTATGAADDEQRAWLALDWLVRTHTPAWLRLVPSLTPHADALAALPPIDDPMALSEARVAATAAAWDAARAAAGDVWDAALDAVGDALVDAASAGAAATAAARVAAWGAAGDAAWDAASAGVAATAAARDAAWAAARDVWDVDAASARAAATAAARVAARDVARVAAWDAGDAAWGAALDKARAARDAAWAARDAVRAALRPTVVELQASACDLIRRMCAVGRGDAVNPSPTRETANA